MDLKEKYQADPQKMKDGVWMEMDDSETEFLMTYYNSQLAQLYFNGMLKTLAISFPNLPKEEITIMAMNATLINVIVLGWRKLKEDGVVLEYSIETFTRLLVEYDGLGVDLMQKSLDISKFRADAVQETTGK